MHSPLDALYTNEISREALCHLDDLYLEQRHLEGYGEEVAAFVNRQPVGRRGCGHVCPEAGVAPLTFSIDAS